jgi:hypothetical protein
MKKTLQFFLILIASVVLEAQSCTPSKKTKVMISYPQALKLATDKLNEISGNDPEYVIWVEKTIVKPYGWLFMPATKAYIKTGDLMSLVPGISPILVNSEEATAIMLPSSVSLKLFMEDYERRLKKQ